MSTVSLVNFSQLNIITITATNCRASHIALVPDATITATTGSHTIYTPDGKTVVIMDQLGNRLFIECNGTADSSFVAGGTGTLVTADNTLSILNSYTINGGSSGNIVSSNQIGALLDATFATPTTNSYLSYRISTTTTMTSTPRCDYLYAASTNTTSNGQTYAAGLSVRSLANVLTSGTTLSFGTHANMLSGMYYVIAYATYTVSTTPYTAQLLFLLNNTTAVLSGVSVRCEATVGPSSQIVCATLQGMVVITNSGTTTGTLYQYISTSTTNNEGLTSGFGFDRYAALYIEQIL